MWPGENRRDPETLDEALPDLRVSRAGHAGSVTALTCQYGRSTCAAHAHSVDQAKALSINSKATMLEKWFTENYGI